METFLTIVRSFFIVWGDAVYSFFHYWKNPRFAQVQLCLIKSYFFETPFRRSRLFLKKRGEKNLFQYGETPLCTLEKIAHFAGVQPTDTVFELGAGRGKVAFWFALILKAKTIAIEQIPEFVQISKKIIDQLNLQNIEFREGNFLTADLSGATVLYLYGSAMEDQEITALAKKIALLGKGIKIISVSFNLSDYDESRKILTMREEEFLFPWGKGTVYLSTING